MLFIGRIIYSDWYQDEKDEQGPDDLNQQLDLRHNGWWQSLINEKKAGFKIFMWKNKLIIPKQWVIYFLLCFCVFVYLQFI